MDSSDGGEQPLPRRTSSGVRDYFEELLVMTPGQILKEFKEAEEKAKKNKKEAMQWYKETDASDVYDYGDGDSSDGGEQPLPGRTPEQVRDYFEELLVMAPGQILKEFKEAEEKAKKNKKEDMQWYKETDASDVYDYGDGGEQPLPGRTPEQVRDYFEELLVMTPGQILKEFKEAEEKAKKNKKEDMQWYKETDASDVYDYGDGGVEIPGQHKKEEHARVSIKTKKPEPVLVGLAKYRQNHDNMPGLDY